MSSSANVQQGKMCPGVNGAFNLTIDASGSDVALIYKIVLNNFSNKPVNLNFYEDQQFTKQISCVNGQINMNRYISLQNISTPIVKTIYWNWPYETGTQQDEIDANDDIDTLEQGKQVSFDVSVIATQADSTGVNQKLAKMVEVGDYVNYTPTTVSTPYQITQTYSGSNSTQSITQENLSWRVMKKDEITGEVILIADAPTTQTIEFGGAVGYNNAVYYLNDICKTFYGKQGVGTARSIKLEDIEYYSTFDKIAFELDGVTYGDTYVPEYTSDYPALYAY